MPKLPAEIGKYKILSCLGTGGTSIVYTATHPTLKRKVVLKKLNLRGNRRHYERFRQEAALMMDLNHDNIVRVFDHFKEGSRHYIVMEFVEGCSLDEVLKKGGALSPGASRYILSRCCRAMEYIHSRNIIHRDIKPSNIFISLGGEVKLGDFGIAQLESESQEESAFVPIGTPSYMAPEQFQPRGGISKKTDIYALGLTLYELLTAQKLYDGASLEELRRKVLQGRRPSLLPLLFSRGPLLFWLIRRSIFRSPALRFPRVRSLQRLLKASSLRSRRREDPRETLRVLVESSLGKKAPSGSRNSRPVSPPKAAPRRKRLFIAGGLGAGLVLLGLGGLGLSLRTGGFYRFFFRESRGALQLRVLSRGESFPHSGDLHLYRDRSRYLELVKEWDLSEEGGIAPVSYLETGNYRVMARWGSQVEWSLFYLPPFSRQEEVLVVEIRREEVPQKPLTVRPRIRDGLSGRDLSSLAVISVQRERERWFPIEGLLLMTGEAYRLKIEAPGYYPRYLNTPVQFYQDLLKLNVQMIPLPGTLAVSHELESLTLFVDGAKEIPGGGEDKAPVRFGRLPRETREWELSPGTYRLRFVGAGQSLETELRVRSSQRYGFSLSLEGERLVWEPD